MKITAAMHLDAPSGTRTARVPGREDFDGDAQAAPPSEMELLPAARVGDIDGLLLGGVPS